MLDLDNVPLTGIKPPYAIAREMAAGALSCMVASAVTNPLDVLRINMQMVRCCPIAPNTLNPTTHCRPEMISIRNCFHMIKNESGWRGVLFPGMSATLLREVFYSSVRFGLYGNIKSVILEGKYCASRFYEGLLSSTYLQPFRLVPVQSSLQSLNFFDKLLAGMLTGAFGSAIANPTDLVKMRIQHEYGLVCRKTGLYSSGPFKGNPPTYKSTFHAFFDIAKREGFGQNGLMKGVYATMTRSALITGGQLASYESAKSYFKSHGELRMTEGPRLHVICSIWSGLVSATLCAPADIVKTRLMCDREASKSVIYRNAWDCFCQILRKEGPIGLYRGWLPSYLRLAPHFIISLPLNEQFRKFFGVSVL